MFKKLLLPLILFVSFYSNAQIHYKGLSAVELSGAVTGKGYGGGVAYSKFVNSSMYYKIGLFTEMAKIVDDVSKITLNNNNYTLDLKFVYTPIKVKSKFYVGTFLGACATLENVGKTELSKADTKFIYGPTFGLESEYYINTNFAIIGNFTQRYYPTSKLGTLRYNIGLGLKYIFI
jgi:hypothetical protein